MGQKVDPRWYRVGISQPWPCEWIAKTKNQSVDFFVEDIKIRQFIEKEYHRSWIWKIVIRKTENDWEVIIFTAKPAVLIGKEWKKLQEFQDKLKKKFNKDLKVSVKEIKSPELSSKIMAEFIADRLEKRMPYKKVAKSVLQKVKDKWALWVKVQVWGRLGWVDLSRTEKFIEGRVPLQTLRADIDYHYEAASTKYGILGVKVWIYKWDTTIKTPQKKKTQKKNK